MNECETSWQLCDVETTICVNVVGTYECQCKNSGFQKKRPSDKECSGTFVLSSLQTNKLLIVISIDSRTIVVNGTYIGLFG